MSFFPREGRWDDPLLAWITHDGSRSWLSSQGGNLVVNVFGWISEVAKLGDEKWRLGRCEGCKKPLFVIVDQAEKKILRIYPPVSGERPEHIAPAVADDFIEGNLCLSMGAHKAAVTMFRRALQAAAIHLGCAPRAKLKTQLRELVTKDLLNKSLASVANQVRAFGNYGAHPDDDGLGDIGEDESAAIRDLTWQILEDLFINPAKTKVSRIALKKKKGNGEPEADEIADD